MVLQKKDCCVCQFFFFSGISIAHAGVEDIEQAASRASDVWMDTLSPEGQFLFNKNDRKYSV
jgi:hypothetical protein